MDFEDFENNQNWKIMDFESGSAQNSKEPPGFKVPCQSTLKNGQNC
jgi:hypothetical protein